MSYMKLTAVCLAEKFHACLCDEIYKIMAMNVTMHA